MVWAFRNIANVRECSCMAVKAMASRETKTNTKRRGGGAGGVGLGIFAWRKGHLTQRSYAVVVYVYTQNAKLVRFADYPSHETRTEGRDARMRMWSFRNRIRSNIANRLSKLVVLG